MSHTDDAATAPTSEEMEVRRIAKSKNTCYEILDELNGKGLIRCDGEWDLGRNIDSAGDKSLASILIEESSPALGDILSREVDLTLTDGLYDNKNPAYRAMEMALNGHPKVALRVFTKVVETIKMHYSFVASPELSKPSKAGDIADQVVETVLVGIKEEGCADVESYMRETLAPSYRLHEAVMKHKWNKVRDLLEKGAYFVGNSSPLEMEDGREFGEYIIQKSLGHPEIMEGLRAMLDRGLLSPYQFLDKLNDIVDDRSPPKTKSALSVILNGVKLNERIDWAFYQALESFNKEEVSEMLERDPNFLTRLLAQSGKFPLDAAVELCVNAQDKGKRNAVVNLLSVMVDKLSQLSQEGKSGNVNLYAKDSNGKSLVSVLMNAYPGSKTVMKLVTKMQDLGFSMSRDERDVLVSDWSKKSSSGSKGLRNALSSSGNLSVDEKVDLATNAIQAGNLGMLKGVLRPEDFTLNGAIEVLQKIDKTLGSRADAFKNDSVPIAKAGVFDHLAILVTSKGMDSLKGCVYNVWHQVSGLKNLKPVASKIGKIVSPQATPEYFRNDKDIEALCKSKRYNDVLTVLRGGGAVGVKASWKTIEDIVAVAMAGSGSTGDWKRVVKELFLARLEKNKIYDANYDLVSSVVQKLGMYDLLAEIVSSPNVSMSFDELVLRDMLTSIANPKEAVAQYKGEGDPSKSYAQIRIMADTLKPVVEKIEDVARMALKVFKSEVRDMIAGQRLQDGRRETLYSQSSEMYKGVIPTLLYMFSGRKDASLPTLFNEIVFGLDAGDAESIMWDLVRTAVSRGDLETVTWILDSFSRDKSVNIDRDRFVRLLTSRGSLLETAIDDKNYDMAAALITNGVPIPYPMPMNSDEKDVTRKSAIKQALSGRVDYAFGKIDCSPEGPGIVHLTLPDDLKYAFGSTQTIDTMSARQAVRTFTILDSNPTRIPDVVNRVLGTMKDALSCTTPPDPDIIICPTTLVDISVPDPSVSFESVTELEERPGQFGDMSKYNVAKVVKQFENDGKKSQAEYRMLIPKEHGDVLLLENRGGEGISARFKFHSRLSDLGVKMLDNQSAIEMWNVAQDGRCSPLKLKLSGSSVPEKPAPTASVDSTREKSLVEKIDKSTSKTKRGTTSAKRSSGSSRRGGSKTDAPGYRSRRSGRGDATANSNRGMSSVKERSVPKFSSDFNAEPALLLGSECFDMDSRESSTADPRLSVNTIAPPAKVDKEMCRGKSMTEKLQKSRIEPAVSESCVQSFR